MPKVRVSSPNFYVDVLDYEPEIVVFESKSVYRSIDGEIPIRIIESDTLLNAVIEIKDSTYGTAK